MTTLPVQANVPDDDTSFDSSDMMALASHMGDCERSHGALLPLRSALERAKALAAGHLVTTGAMVGAAGLCLLLALA